MAHFIQADTVVPDSTNALSYDRYVYVNDNPIRYSDPTGHMDYAGEGGGGQWYYKPKFTLYILTGDKDWTEKEKEVIKSTVNMEKEKMGKYINQGSRGGERYSDDEAFLKGFQGMVEFYRSNESKDYAGWGGDPNKVIIYDLNRYNKETGIFTGIQYNYVELHEGIIAHELGHVFRNSNYASGVFSDLTGLGREDYGDKNNGYHGFFGGKEVGQFAVTNIASGSEILADMFVGWTYGMFWDNALGVERASFMYSAIRTILKN